MWLIPTLAVSSSLLQLQAILNKTDTPQLIPRYTQDTIDDNVAIPQFDIKLHDYEGSRFLDPIYQETEESLSSYIDQASASNDQDTLVFLGDLYMFGQGPIKPNYKKALDFYQKLVESAPHGHAYFMLGFIYSTGLFGEVPKDKALSSLYYLFASENGNLNATMALANKYHYGVDLPPNCELAQFYYSRVARIAANSYFEKDISPNEASPKFDVSLPDFNGGLYGRKVSESVSSLHDLLDTTLENTRHIKEYVHNHDPILRDYFYEALTSYLGSRFEPPNYEKAYFYARICEEHGSKQFLGKPLRVLDSSDRLMLSNCNAVLGTLYFKGKYVKRNFEKAYKHFNKAQKIWRVDSTMFYMGAFHSLDPTTNGALSENATRWLKDAMLKGSMDAKFKLSKWLSLNYDSPFMPRYTPQIYKWFRSLSANDYSGATFYYADALESGYAASIGERHTCSDVVKTYKKFVELCQDLLLPQLQFGFKQFLFGNYKNALLGFLLAAEQGVKHAQISAAYLLYQLEPYFSRNPKTFDKGRVESAISFLELASLQEDPDSTVLLGDISYHGVPSAGISPDERKAFAYYSKAASMRSPHGCFKLGNMYEYGFNNASQTKDYFMAKRYYDLSVQYTQEIEIFTKSKRNDKRNVYPMSLALLRLRLKLLFSRSGKDNMDKTDWFGTFKKLSHSQEGHEESDGDSRANRKATAHFEGESIESDDEYEIFDYVVLFLTVSFFLFVFVQNARGQFRRARDRGNGAEAPGNRNWANQNGFQFRRGNFEFHFFAL